MVSSLTNLATSTVSQVQSSTGRNCEYNKADKLVNEHYNLWHYLPLERALKRLLPWSKRSDMSYVNTIKWWALLRSMSIVKIDFDYSKDLSALQKKYLLSTV